MGKLAKLFKSFHLIPTASADAGGSTIKYVRNRLLDNGRFSVSGENDDPIVKSPEQLAQSTPAFTYPGYVFVEWNTSADGTGTSYAVGSTNSNYNTLYAIWQKGNSFYSVNHGDLTDIADEIRIKSSDSSLLVFPNSFINQLQNVVTSTEIGLIPAYSSETVSLSGSTVPANSNFIKSVTFENSNVVGTFVRYLANTTTNFPNGVNVARVMMSKSGSTISMSILLFNTTSASVTLASDVSVTVTYTHFKEIS